MSEIKSEEKWFWMMNWCKKEGLAPSREEIWKLAENTYNQKINIESIETISFPKE